jgi:hypothetical protein
MRNLESHDASRTLAEQLAPTFGELFSLKRLVANLKEILEPGDYTFQIFDLPRTSSEALSPRIKMYRSGGFGNP